MNVNKIISAITILLAVTACSERSDKSFIASDGTIIYSAKSGEGINASIDFGLKFSRKSGRMINPDTVFTIEENAKVNAVVNFTNTELNDNKELLIHIDWLTPDGNSIYKKQINLLKNDSTSVLTSSISISPGKRNPGIYALRIYLFRELIAEKYFRLTTEKIKREVKTETAVMKKKEKVKKIKVKKKISADVIFCSKIEKQSGRLIGEGKEFIIKNKNKVYAVVNLKNLVIKPGKKKNIYLKWINPGDSLIYSKKFSLTSENSLSAITSSISISPGKREAGKYTLRIYSSKKLIAQKQFTLINEAPR